MICGRTGSKFLEIVNWYAPLSTRRVRPKQNPWLTRGIKKMMNERDKLKSKATKTKNHIVNDWNNFNQSLIMGIFPSRWKIAKVFPLHKGGEKNLATNYRPISVLSAVTKPHR